MKQNKYSKISEVLLEILSHIPESKVGAETDAEAQVDKLITTASRKSGAISGLLSLPVGPLGMATILPDLVAVWTIQRQLAADIAHIYGRSHTLNRDTMLYCLFHHGQSSLQDVVFRVGQRYFVRRSSQKAFTGFIGKIGMRIGRVILGESIARWIPVIGAVAGARYSQKDTEKVGATARELFRHEIEIQESKD